MGKLKSEFAIFGFNHDTKQRFRPGRADQHAADALNFGTTCFDRA